MSLQEVTERVRSGAGSKPGFGNTVKFAFPEGVIYVDGTGATNTVSNDDKSADCTIKMSLDDFKALAAGELDGTVAFMTGKLKIDGDMGVAMKLGSLLRS